MKKSLFAFMLLFLLVPTMASAHTGLASSTPSKGEVVKKDLFEVSTVFETKIESLSTMKLMKDNKEVPFDRLKVMESQMIGEFSTPLENGSYQLEWKIVGKDGHPITGVIPFSVDQAKKKEVNKDSLTEPKATSKEENKEVEKRSINQQSKSEETKNNSSFPITMVIVLGLIIIVVFLVSLKKKK